MNKFTVGIESVDGLNGQVVVMRNRAGRSWFYNQTCILTVRDTIRMNEFSGQVADMVNADEKLNAMYWTEIKAA